MLLPLLQGGRGVKCPACSTTLCGECGHQLTALTQVPESRACEDHRELCNECAYDLWCVDCDRKRRGA